MLKIKSKIGTGAAMALQIIEEGKRPMSPAQIQAKYQLEFPFTVRRVVRGYLEERICKCEFNQRAIEVGAVLTFVDITIESGSYEYARCKQCCTINSVVPDSERFVWIGEPT